MVKSTALVTRIKDGKARLELEDVDLPNPQADQVLVKVHSIAQNPTDVQCLDLNAFGEGAVLGCDFVGTVEAIGSNVTRSQKGDIVAGLIWGGEAPGIGAYSKSTYATEKLYFRVPSSVKQTDAATIPLACTTAWLAIFSSRCLGVDREASDKTPLLIWGGSSSVGLFAIQLAKLYSIPTVAICSSRHFELCKSLGAAWTFDYHDQDVIANIKEDVSGIRYVFDCIGSSTSSTQASQATDEKGGRLCTVRPGKVFTDNVEKRVEISDVLVWTAFLRDHAYKEFNYPASEEDHNLASELFGNIAGWLQDGKLKPNPVRIVPGGLSAVEEGFQLYRDGIISGFKVVYEL